MTTTAVRAPATVLVRRNVWTLDGTSAFGAVTSAYATGVARMQARDAADPTSWTYQAAMHGTYAQATAGQDWNQCQHAGWFFLPWHRMYLYFFERIVRRAVVEAGGPTDWTIPYWDYGVGGQAAGIPLAFRSESRPDGSPNPLFTEQRADGVNQGARLPTRQTSAAKANTFTTFAGLARACFGGGAAGPVQFATVPGQLEVQPHNVVHDLLGGASGWMGDPRQAARDPIFWLHHANVDRLWDRWIGLGGGRADPADAKWRGARFRFFDADGSSVELSPADVVDAAASLGYRYDDAPTPADRTLRRRLALATSPPPLPPGPPTLVAASTTGTDLGAGRTGLAVPVDEQAERRIAGVADDPADPGRVVLTVDDIAAEQPGVVYEVHLNLPDDADPATEDSFLVGQLTFFGTAAGDRGEQRAGMSHSYDITGLVENLRAAGRWTPDRLTVTFVPVGLAPPPGVAGSSRDVAPASTPSVGRVSIHVV